MVTCDLERRQAVTLLPDRESATSEAWLRHHSSITIVARDRGGGYGEAVAKAFPFAEQVADRWHLMGTPTRRFWRGRKSMRQFRSVIGATVINPALLTCAERLQYWRSRGGPISLLFRPSVVSPRASAIASSCDCMNMTIRRSERMRASWSIESARDSSRRAAIL